MGNTQSCQPVDCKPVACKTIINPLNIKGLFEIEASYVKNNNL